MVNCTIGSGVRIFHEDLVNVYGATIGNDTSIGPFVEIQSGAVIGQRCKIQSHTFICEGVTIEDEVFIGHGVMFTNDLFPRATNLDGTAKTTDDWTLTPTLVASKVSIGSGATILPGIVIGHNSMIGAGSVITKNVPPNVIVAGNPARVLRPTNLLDE